MNQNKKELDRLSKTNKICSYISIILSSLSLIISLIALTKKILFH